MLQLPPFCRWSALFRAILPTDLFDEASFALGITCVPSSHHITSSDTRHLRDSMNEFHGHAQAQAAGKKQH